MTISLIKVGSLVRDWHGRVGLVCAKETAPPKAWLNEQRNVEEIRKLGPTDWWGVAPLDGGYLLVAGPLLTFLRDATYADFLQVADHANAFGREHLVKVFPEFVNRLLAERGSSSAK